MANLPGNSHSGSTNKVQEMASTVAEKVREVSGTVTEKGREIATSATDKAREAAGNVADKARDTASSVASNVGDLAGNLGQRVGETAATVGSGMQSLAGTIREGGMLGSAGSTLATGLERGGRYLQEEGFRGIGEEVTNLIRRNPLPAVLVGIGLGFLLARATRS